MSENVTQESAPPRFEITTDDGVAGFAQYVDHDGQRIFFHTIIEDAYVGRGLAGAVVRQALDTTRADGLRIVPVCSFVKKYVADHHDWDDLVDPVTPAALQAIPSSTS